MPASEVVQTAEKPEIKRRAPPKRLTVVSVERMMLPDKGQKRVFDAGMPGLILRLNSGGTKTWHAIHYQHGKARITKLGRYPIMSLDDARTAARKFLADPNAALRQAQAGSFEEVAEEFLRRHVHAKNLRSAKGIERNLRKLVIPKWGHRPFHEINRGDVSRLLDEIEDRSGPRMADAVLAIVRKLTNWHQARNGDYVSPVVRGMNRSNPSEQKRKRILSDDEIRSLWAATSHLGTFGALARMLLLTAQRREKVAQMKWTDVQNGTWTIASERREKGNAEVIQLPPFALAVLEGQSKVDNNPYVFPAAAGRGPLNSFSQRKAELDAAMKISIPDLHGWVLHDLRRTARSLMSRADVRPDIAERVLGHAILGVEGTYDRHTYLAHKSDALLRLAKLVIDIVSPAHENVVHFHKKA